jgi:hypothetical protein
MYKVCKNKCKELLEECKESKKRLWRLAEALQEPEDAVKEVLGEVMDGAE